MSAIGQLDIFIARTRKVIFANVQPAIGDVVHVGKHGLVDHHLVRFARVTDRIDRALRGRASCWNPDVNSIQPHTGARREIPLGSACRRTRARPRIADRAALRASHGDVIPTLVRCFIETKRAIIYNRTGQSRGRIGKRRTRGINPRAVIDQRGIRHP